MLAQAREISLRSKVSAYWSDASDAKPTSDAARNGRAMKMRRRLRMVQTMRVASANDGGASSALAPVPGSAASRSKWPRPGSVSLSPAITSRNVGTANTKNGARHPS